MVEKRLLAVFIVTYALGLAIGPLPITRT